MCLINHEIIPRHLPERSSVFEHQFICCDEHIELIGALLAARIEFKVSDDLQPRMPLSLQ